MSPRKFKEATTPGTPAIHDQYWHSQDCRQGLIEQLISDKAPTKQAMEQALKAYNIRVDKGLNKKEIGVVLLKYLLPDTPADESSAEDLD
jgi:hypothetical protein